LLYSGLFSPQISVTDLPAHVFLKSVHNIVIERGWWSLTLEWGGNVDAFWHAGNEIYNADDGLQQYNIIVQFT
jgi:hypothetical protein